MKLGQKFNANSVEEMNSFDAVPADEYHLKVKSSKSKDNKAKIAAAANGETIKGTICNFTFEIMAGPFKGRLLFTNLNLEHTSPQTEDFAYRELGSICKAVGRLNIEETDELNGGEFMAKVVVTPKTTKYPEGNEIKKYMPLKGIAKPTSPAAEKEEGEKPAKKKPTVSFDD